MILHPEDIAAIKDALRDVIKDEVKNALAESDGCKKGGKK